MPTPARIPMSDATVPYAFARPRDVGDLEPFNRDTTTVDPGARVMYCVTELGTHSRAMTRSEVILSMYLLRNTGKMCSHDALIERLYGSNPDDGLADAKGVVKVFIRQLRVKFASIRSTITIRSVHGVGYIVDAR